MEKEFIELFENYKSPIDDDKVVEEIVKLYGNNWFYNEISKIGAEDKCKEEYPIKDMDIFYSNLFNLWKKNILEKTNIDEKQQFFEGNYIAVVRILKKIPDIHTYKEFCSINKKYLLIKNYGMFYTDGCWMYVTSRYINGTKKRDIKADYRLYINAEANDVYKIVCSFIYKCYENQLPFEFKFVKYAEDLPDRADSIVIWADEETLFKYIQILNEIQEKRSDIIARCKRPPILTMPINNWVGFGQEPPESSYTYYRIDILQDAIRKATLKWIAENKNTTIKNRDNKLTVKEYMAISSVKEKAKIINDFFEMFPEKEFYEDGIKKDEINNEWCIKAYEFLVDKVIPELYNGKRKIEYIDGTKKITFYFKKSIEETCKLLIKSPNRKKDFIQSIREIIKTESKKYGISSKNFAFNIEYEKEVMKSKETERD